MNNDIQRLINARNAYENSLKKATNLNNLIKKNNRVTAANTKLKNLRARKNATPANYKNAYKEIRNARNNLFKSARASLNKFRALPNPPANPNWVPWDLRFMRIHGLIHRHLSVLRNRGAGRGGVNLPRNKQVKTIQRFSRGLIARKRLANPHWGRTYANVVAGRPGIGERAIRKRLGFNNPNLIGQMYKNIKA